MREEFGTSMKTVSEGSEEVSSTESMSGDSVVIQQQVGFSEATSRYKFTT
jgi:hypothetical protein